MKNLQIDEENARRLYPQANGEFKAILEDTFGKSFFNRKITDRIKTFEDALKELPEIASNVAILLAYNGVDKDMLASVAHMKLTIIARVLNEGWKPNWDNSSEYKYYPYFDMRSGVGFSVTGYDYWYANACVGSRLCFKSRELAEYAGKQFLPLYKDLMVL
jgi:hypothetical protein